MLKTVVAANADIAHQYRPDLDEAIACSTELLRLNPKDAEAYKVRGIAYMRKGRYVRQWDYLGRGVLDRAIADFTAAIQINPKDVKSYTSRSVAYRQKGEVDHAKADNLRAMQLAASPG